MPQNVMITGAGKGLGYCLVLEFLEKGWNVIALVKNKNEATGQLGKTYNGRVTIVEADVSMEKKVQKAFQKVEKDFPSIDLLINNAAIYLKTTQNDILDTDPAAVLEMLDVNAVGPLLVAKYFLPLLLKGKSSKLVNISSEAGGIGHAWRKSEYGYCMSKAALNMFSQLMQNRLKDQGVKVLAIHPGWLQTDMGGKDATDPTDQAARDIYQTINQDWEIDGPVYMDRLGQPMDW